MGKTIAEMLADGVSAAEIHKMVDTELQKKKDAEAAAKKKAAETKAAREKMNKAKQLAAIAVVDYLVYAEAITIEDSVVLCRIVEKTLADMAEDMKSAKKMNDLIERIFSGNKDFGVKVKAKE